MPNNVLLNRDLDKSLLRDVLDNIDLASKGGSKRYIFGKMAANAYREIFTDYFIRLIWKEK